MRRIIALVLAGSFAAGGCFNGGGGAPETAFVQEPARNPAWGIDQNDNPRSILLHSGEYVLARTDMAVRARRLGFRFTRVWRSRNARTTALGRGWDANVFTRLEVLADGTVRHHEGTGRFDDYAPAAAPAGGGGDATFLAPPGRYRMLRRQGDGTFVLRDRDGLRCFFDAGGKITRMRDRIGNECAYEYDAAGRLATFTDDMGRSTVFAYDADGRLTSITDFTGRAVRYAYDGSRRLTDVTSPAVVGTPHGNDFPDGKTEAYEWDDRDRVVAIVSPNEVADGSRTPTQTMSYDAVGRVVATTVGGTNASGVPAGGTIRYTYSPAAADPANTRVEDRNGNVTDYVFDLAGHVTMVTEQGAGGPFVTRYEYNGDGEVTRVVLPAGNSIESTYDEDNRDPFQRGNRLAWRLVPDAARGGDQEALLTTYAYEPLYNRLRTVTTPRGNDATYVPQNGGAQSAGRYTTTFTFDYQEAALAPPEAAEFGIMIPPDLLGLGDVNGDGVTDQAAGNVVRVDRPTATLLPGSNQAAAAGDALQEIVDRYSYNAFGQRTEHEDARGNIRVWVYFPENDPDGDGEDPTPGRDPVTGGYLRQTTRDARVGPRRRDPGDPVQIVEAYAYDRRGNRITRTDGRGLVHRTTFNELDQVVETEDPPVDPGQANGYRRRTFYDFNDNVVRRQVEDVTTDPETHTPTAGGTFLDHVFDYDILDNPVRQDLDATRDPAIPASAQPERLVTGFRWDANENLIEITRPEGNRITCGYDARDLRTVVTRGAGSRDASTRRRGYDANRNLRTFTDAVGPDTHTWHYDGFDRCTGWTDRAGSELLRTFDPDGHAIRIEFHGPVDGDDPVHVPLEGRDRLFDELGRLIRVDRDLFVPGGAPAGAGAPTVADGALTPDDGKVSTAYEYDQVSRLAFLVRDDLATYAHRYDGANRRVRTDLPLPGTFVELAWDANDHLVRRVEHHASPEDLVEPVQLVTHYVRDEVNRVERRTDPKGQTTVLEYDSRDNVVSTYDARGPLVPDPEGLYPGEINDRGNPVRHRYDGVGRRWQTVVELRVGGRGENPLDTTGPFNPDGLVAILTEWDGNGRVSARTDDNGNTTRYEYDALDRRSRRTNADGGVRMWQWDADNRPVGTTDENGTVHARTFDGLDRLRSHTVTPNPARAIPGTELPVLVGSTVLSWDYDGLSRVTRCTDDNDPADATDDAVVTVRYDSLGRRVREDQNGRAVGRSYVADDHAATHYPNGRVVEYAYDPHNQPTEISDDRIAVRKRYLGACTATILETWVRAGDVTVAEQRRTLDENKLVQRIENVDGLDRSVGAIDVTRNRVDDVTSANIGAAVPGTPATLDLVRNSALDSRGRVVAHDRGEAGGAGFPGAPGIVDFGGGLLQIDYGGAQDPRRETRGPEVRDLGRDAVHQRDAFTFDAGGTGNGLRTGDDEFLFQWDGFDRLRVVRLASDPDTIVAEYDYDASPAVAGGRRVRKSTGAGVTEYSYDGAHVVEERDGNNAVTRQFLYGPLRADDVLAMDVDTDADGNPDTLFFHLKDWNNNVTHLVDGNGQLATFTAYDLRGTPEFHDGILAPEPGDPTGNPYLFQGRRFDPETGLYYFRARYYDPAAGEFLSRDPAGFWRDTDHDGNPFAFASNSPFNVLEPTGSGRPTIVDRSPFREGLLDHLAPIPESTGLQGQPELLFFQEIWPGPNTVAPSSPAPGLRLRGGYTVLPNGLVIPSNGSAQPLVVPRRGGTGAGGVRWARRALIQLQGEEWVLGGQWAFSRADVPSAPSSPRPLLAPLPPGAPIGPAPSPWPVPERGDVQPLELPEIVIQMSAITWVVFPGGDNGWDERAQVVQPILPQVFYPTADAPGATSGATDSRAPGLPGSLLDRLHDLSDPILNGVGGLDDPALKWEAVE